MKNKFLGGKFMTYKQLTKQIDRINEQIKYMYQIQEDARGIEEKKLCGFIIDNLICWKNTLIYDKDYVEKGKEI